MTVQRSDYEPTAGSRAFARAMFDMYQAMIKEGFSREDALEILRGLMAANIGGREA